MNRLIDADLYKEDMTKEFPEYYEEVLDAQPTIEAGPEWIPCSERLPEMPGNYIVTAYVYDSKKAKDIISTSAYWHDDWLLEGVIAWMDFPEPYGVEE